MLQANVIETPQKSLERYEVKYILHSQAMCGSSHSTHQSASISINQPEIQRNPPIFWLRWSFSQIYPTIFSYDIFSAITPTKSQCLDSSNDKLCHIFPGITFSDPHHGHLFPGQSRWKRDHSAGAHLWRGHTQRGAATGRGAGAGAGAGLMLAISKINGDINGVITIWGYITSILAILVKFWVETTPVTP